MEKKDVVMFFGAKHKNGEFSNQYMAKFEIFGHVYNCVEQYAMSQMALMFRDFKAFNRILDSKDPVEMRKLGSEVQNFDYKRWERVKRKVVKSGVAAKFAQNEELKAKLLATGERQIAMASPADRVWGIGFCKSSQDVMERVDEWGENLLGKILMEVREELRTA